MARGLLRPTGSDRVRASRGFSAVYAMIALVVVGLIALIGVIVANSQTSDSSLVPIEGPKITSPQPAAPKSTDGVPAGYVAYTNAEAGFSFVYPASWGALQAVAEPAAVLSMSTPALNAYSLADALTVRADAKASVQIPIGSKGVTVRPTDSGTGLDWIVVERGADKVTPGKPYTPAPTVAYRSGKAVVYAIAGSRDNCTYTTWVFGAQGNIVRLRIPSFCISDKAADADVQAGHKAEYDAAKATILRSIVVL